MVIKELYQHRGVEELLGICGGKSVLYDVVVFILPEPYSDRHGEAKLFLVCGLWGSCFQGCLSHGKLCVFGAYPVLPWYLLRKLHYLFVKKRYSQLKGVCHGHFICFQQDIACHPQVQVKILHFGDRILALYLVIERRCDNCRVGSGGGYFQQLLSVLWCEHISVSDEALFKLLAVSYKKINTPLLRKMLCHAAYASSDKLRKRLVCV